MSEKQTKLEKLNQSKTSLHDLENISAEVISTPSTLSEEEKENFDHAKQKEEIEDIKHYRKLRETYASRCFMFLVSWCVILCVILILNGFPCIDFNLSDSVLITLIGTTTINVIGLVVVIVKGLFK